MANVLENLLSQPVVYTDITGSLQKGLTGGIEAGFNLAAKQFELQKQQAAVKADMEENQREAMLKAASLLPKIKTARGPEKSLYLKYFSSLSKSGGIEIGDDLLELLNKSPTASTDLASMVESSRAASGNDPVKFAAKFYGALQEAGIDPSSATEVWKAIDAENKILIEREKINSERQLKLRDQLEKNLSEAGASQSFREKLDTLPEELKIPASAAHLAAKKRLDSIADKVFRDENFMKNIAPAEQDAVRKLYNFAAASIQDPQTALKADTFISNLESSINNAAGLGSQMIAKREEEQQNRLANKERRQIINDASENLRKKFKEEIETIKFASKALNILSNPDVAGTPLGADAIVSLLARYLDPKTGVKEGEFNRIRSATGGTPIKKIELLAKSILKGRYLDEEQRSIVSKLIAFEVNELNKQIQSAKDVLDFDLKDTDIDPDHVLMRVFDIDPNTKTLRVSNKFNDLIAGAFKRDGGTTFSDWYNGKLKKIDSSVSSGRLSPEIEAKIKSAKSGFSKLMGKSQVSNEVPPQQSDQLAPEQSQKKAIDFNSLSEEQLKKYIETGEI